MRIKNKVPTLCITIKQTIIHNRILRIMNTYQITFITLDGNKQDVFIEGRSETNAEMEFSRQYEYDEILSCECVSDNEESENDYELESFEESSELTLNDLLNPQPLINEVYPPQNAAKTEKGLVIAISVENSIKELNLGKNVLVIEWCSFPLYDLKQISKDVYVDFTTVKEYTKEISEMYVKCSNKNINVYCVFKYETINEYKCFPLLQTGFFSDIIAHFDKNTNSFEIVENKTILSEKPLNEILKNLDLKPKGDLIAISVQNTFEELIIKTENAQIVNAANMSAKDFKGLQNEIGKKEIYIDFTGATQKYLDALLSNMDLRFSLLHLVQNGTNVYLVFKRPYVPIGNMIFPNVNILRLVAIAKHLSKDRTGFITEKNIYEKIEKEIYKKK